MIHIIDGLTFDDVLLIPKYSEVRSRSDVDLSVKLSKGLKFSFPIIPANMKTICGPEMADAIHDIGGLAILHRFMSNEEQINLAKKYSKENKLHSIGFSIGVKEIDYFMVDSFAKYGVKIITIDIAHGDSKRCVEMTKYIAEKYPDIFLISGNVATGEGAKRLWEAGADCVKCGVGSGSLCTTRVETGHGSPQLTALNDVWETKGLMENRLNKKLFVISDGGAKNTGDFVKAMVFSDMVMTGNIFSGAFETPGDILCIDGIQYKNYVGSSTHKANHVEGVAALVQVKSKAKDIINKLCQGINSGLSYQGVSNLAGLKEDPVFVKISNAGLIESHPHDVLVVK